MTRFLVSSLAAVLGLTACDRRVDRVDVDQDDFRRIDVVEMDDEARMRSDTRVDYSAVAEMRHGEDPARTVYEAPVDLTLRRPGPVGDSVGGAAVPVDTVRPDTAGGVRPDTAGGAQPDTASLPR